MGVPADLFFYPEFFILNFFTVLKITTVIIDRSMMILRKNTKGGSKRGRKNNRVRSSEKQ